MKQNEIVFISVVLLAFKLSFTVCACAVYRHTKLFYGTVMSET